MPKTIPTPLYPCRSQGCAEEHTWPATDLYWVEERPGSTPDPDINYPHVECGWYCAFCIDNRELDVDSRATVGESLDDYIQQLAGTSPILCR